jgi:ribonucleoside-diphosphate reductase alpha chain
MANLVDSGHNYELAYYDQLHSEKYRDEGQSFTDHCRVTANRLSSDAAHEARLYDMLINRRFLPAGRVQAAMGATQREVSAFNCSVSQTIEDSMDSIMAALSNAAKILRLGTGIGYNFSNLRPKGAEIIKLRTQSSGPLSFMRMFDVMASTIASSGHRRGAQMGIMNVTHPDIEAFIDAKMEKDAYRYFNLSVGVTDDFMKALKYSQEWPLTFNGKVYKTVNARALWDKIMHNAYESAEPGIIFLDNLNKGNNLYYCEKMDATNPCVTGDTLILTRNGYVRIDHLVGKQTEVWNGQEWSMVTPKITGENQDIVVVELNNGYKLECTPYHKFVLNDGSLIEAQNLQPGTKLKEFEFPVMEGIKRISNAYAMGFYQGDGWQDQRGRQWIALYGEKKELLDILMEDKYFEYKISGGYENTDTTQTKYMFRVHGMPEKDFVPSVDWSIQSRLNWFAGLCDSDGTCTYSESSVGIQISSKNRDFLNKTSLMLTTLGAFSRVAPMRDKWRLTIKAKELKHLQALGFNTYRLNIEHNEPRYDVKNTVKIMGVFKRRDKEQKVYCFNEPLQHMGIFNGVLTGQCAEQPLPPNGVCLLGSFNIIAYNQNYEQYTKDIRDVVEAYDNIFERSVYAIPEHQKEAVAKRRMGLGLTAIANTCEIETCSPYGDQVFNEQFEAYAKTLRDTAYDASVDLAIKRGPFAKWSPKYSNSEFVKTLPEHLQEKIHTHGIRNSHLLSYAPCGTISQTAGNVSSGVEPIFHHRVKRQVYMKDGLREVILQDYNVRVNQFEGKTLNECSVDDHISVGDIAQRYCDSAVSKTINVAPTCEYTEYKSIYEKAHSRGLKGITVYRPTPLRGSVIVNADDTKCKDGKCEL